MKHLLTIGNRIPASTVSNNTYSNVSANQRFLTDEDAACVRPRSALHRAVIVLRRCHLAAPEWHLFPLLKRKKLSCSPGWSSHLLRNAAREWRGKKALVLANAPRAWEKVSDAFRFSVRAKERMPDMIRRSTLIPMVRWQD